MERSVLYRAQIISSILGPGASPRGEESDFHRLHTSTRGVSTDEAATLTHTPTFFASSFFTSHDGLSPAILP